jgi:hypothetical protein
MGNAAGGIHAGAVVFGFAGTVPGHGFHPLKARQSWSIPNLQDVH